MPRGKKTKPKTKTVLDLNAFKEQFTAPGNDGQKSQVFVEKKDSGMDWTMEDDPGTPKYEVIDLPSAPRAERINYDESRLDMSQEIFEIRISPLPYDVDSESLRRFFDILEDCEIVSLDIPKGGDDERYSGQAFLKASGRTRLTLEYRDKYQAWATNPNNTHRQQFGRDRPGRDRPDRGGRDGGRRESHPSDAGPWRRGPDDGPRNRNNFNNRDGPRSFNNDRRGSDFGRRDDGPPRERKRLNLVKKGEGADSVPEEVTGLGFYEEHFIIDPLLFYLSPHIKSPISIPTRSKSNPFGNARPVDEQKILEAERRAEEKLKSQSSVVSDSKPRSDPFGGARPVDTNNNQNSTRSRNNDSSENNKPKVDPFGGARPADNSTAEQKRLEAERRAEEKMREQQRKIMESSRDDNNRDRDNDRRDDRRRDSRPSYDRDNRGGGYNDRRGSAGSYNNDRDRGDRGYRSRDHDRNEGRGDYSRRDEQRSRDNNDDYESNRPTERRKLNLKKRDENGPSNDNTNNNPSSSKSNPFGAARPVDANLQLQREKEIEEKLKKLKEQQEKEEAEEKAKKSVLENEAKPPRQIILKKHKNKDQPMTLSSKFSGLVMDDEGAGEDDDSENNSSSERSEEEGEEQNTN